MGRRHLPSSSPSPRTWTLLRFDLSDDESGFLLEHAGRLCGDGDRVHAFRSRDAALAYARDRWPGVGSLANPALAPSSEPGPTVEAIPNGRFYDLRAVEAFVDRRSPAFPSAALDVWSVLGEVARAAGRDVPALKHASLPTVTGTGSSLLEPLRIALASGLDVFRDVVSYAEPTRPLLAAQAVITRRPAAGR